MDALVVIIALLVGVAAFGVWIWGIVDAAQRPGPAWEAAGQNKVLWIVLQVILGAILSLIYLFVIRPKIVAAGG
ncbi:MAG: hypothetical protein ACRD12_10395 [Acidimicrobiales bacterium]